MIQGRPGPKFRLPGVVYQDAQWLQRYAEAGILGEETLASAFRDIARKFPGRVALMEADWHCSFAELDALSDRAGAAFLDLGLKPLDRVLFQLPNCWQLIVAMLACFKTGIIPICTLSAHRQLEIGYIGAHGGAAAHFIEADNPKFDFLAFSRQVGAGIPTLRHRVLFRGGGRDRHPGFEALIAGQDAETARRRLAELEIDPYQVAIFQLSGGTSGVPKIIPRCHNEYLYSLRTVIDFHGLDETTNAYTPNPLIHNSPTLCVWGPALYCGGQVSICDSVAPEILGPFLVRAKPNWMLLAASIALRLKEAGWLDRMDLSRLKGFCAGSGAAKLRSLLEDAPIWPLFGMTEGLLCFCNASDSGDARRGTQGRPLSPHDEVRIFAPDSETELPLGASGELVLRGPSTIRGYYDAAERNAVAFTREGYYRSGDLMRQCEIDGVRYLVFEGRIKDVVDRGGEKINCEEVEQICARHPAIGDIAIVAMPDPAYGQRACAFIVPAAGEIVPDVAQLGGFLHEQGMAKFKWPERVEIVGAFPLTSSGKLSKPKLRAIIEDMLNTEARPAPSAPAPAPRLPIPGENECV